MTIRYNVIGKDRKKLVEAISRQLTVDSNYLGAPSFAYTVGDYNIDKDGAVTGPDNRELVADLCGLYSFRADNEEYDTALPDAFEDLPLTEREELGLGRDRRDPVGEDGVQSIHRPAPCAEEGSSVTLVDQHHPVQYADPDVPVTDEMLRLAEGWMAEQPENDNNGVDSLTIEIPLDGFTSESLENLTKLVASKESLIKKALGADELPIRVLEDRIGFPWFPLNPDDGSVDAYAQFIACLAETAKKKKRVTAKGKESFENEKFAMRVWLIGLGMVGKEYGLARKLLMAKMDGNSGWRFGAPDQRPAGPTGPHGGDDRVSPSDAEVSDVAETLADESGEEATVNE